LFDATHSGRFDFASYFSCAMCVLSSTISRSEKYRRSVANNSSGTSIGVALTWSAYPFAIGQLSWIGRSERRGANAHQRDQIPADRPASGAEERVGTATRSRRRWMTRNV